MMKEVDIAVVGGGLAGMSAALTAARQGWRTAILTGGVIGGQLVSIDHIAGVPGFPEGVAGYDLCPMTQEAADAAGVQFITAECDSITAEGERWRLSSAEGEVLARGVVIATGTSPAPLGAPGESELIGRGVSHCASCDGPLLRGQVAVVVGGGDSGMQEALTLADHASRVVLLERGDALTGQQSYRDLIEANPKIEVRCGSAVTAILGDKTVSGVRLQDLARGTETELQTAAVFPCVGLEPNAGLVKDLLDMDETGRIAVDAGLRSSARGVCAAGNVRQASAHRAAGAMGDGAAAAASLDRYLCGGGWSSGG